MNRQSCCRCSHNHILFQWCCLLRQSYPFAAEGQVQLQEARQLRPRQPGCDPCYGCLIYRWSTLPGVGRVMQRGRSWLACRQQCWHAYQQMRWSLMKVPLPCRLFPNSLLRLIPLCPLCSSHVAEPARVRGNSCCLLSVPSLTPLHDLLSPGGTRRDAGYPFACYALPSITTKAEPWLCV